MYRITYLFFLIVSINLCQAQDAANNGSFGKNLLINGDAEIESPNRQIYSWQIVPARASSDFLQETYGNILGEWVGGCDEKCGLPPNAGSGYFRFPVDDSYKTFVLTQNVNLSEIKDTLVQRNIEFNLSGFVAGFSCLENNCGNGTLSIGFFDAEGKETGSFEVVKDNADFSYIGENKAMMQFEKISAVNLIPEKSVSATIAMKAKNVCCNSAFVFFDNVTFVLTKGEKRDKKSK